MKKYITPSVRVVFLSEEFNLMLTASNTETTDERYFSNRRDEKDSHRSSIWDY